MPNILRLQTAVAAVSGGVAFPASTMRRAAVAMLLGGLALIATCQTTSQAVPQGAPQPQANAPARPRAQSQAVRQKLYRIAGTITNAVTGEPVQRATVSLLNEATGEEIESTESGAEGVFALDPVPAGKYPLRVARRGYMTTLFNEHDDYSSAIVTGDGQDTEHIPFHLNPGGMVHGVVTDDAGEPVQQAQVLLVRKSRASGLGERMIRSISGDTDDTGSFEFWNLLPGNYFLAVKAAPWFAMHPFLSGNGSSASAEQSTAGTALDVAYPVTYYDGATDEAAATPVAIASGDRVELNVALHAVAAIHLLVREPGSDAEDGRAGPVPVLKQTIFGEEEVALSGGLSQGQPGSGIAELAGVAPGHYTVSSGEPARITALDASGSGGQEVDSSGGIPTVAVTVRVRMASGVPLTQQVVLVLRSDSDAPKEIRAQNTGNAELRFDSVPPGAWTILASSENMALAVVSIQTAGATRQGSRILVGDRQLTLNVALAQGATNVTGFAMKDGKGTAGEMIVLVPKNPAANWTLFRRDQSDSDGSFSLHDVVPGRYTVVAIEDGWEMDWARPEVISRYLPKGIGVTVTDNAGKILPLSQPVPVQTR